MNHIWWDYWAQLERVCIMLGTNRVIKAEVRKMWMEWISVNACHLTFKVSEKWQLLLPSNGHRTDGCKSWTKCVFQNLGDRKPLATVKTLPRETLIQLKIECCYVDLLLNLPVGSRTLPKLPAENCALGSSPDVNSIWGSDTAADQHEAPRTIQLLLLSFPGAEKLILACSLQDCWTPVSMSLSPGDMAVGALPKPKELLSILTPAWLSVAVVALLPGATCVHPAWAQKQHLPQRLSRH